MDKCCDLYQVTIFPYWTKGKTQKAAQKRFCSLTTLANTAGQLGIGLHSEKVHKIQKIDAIGNFDFNYTLFMLWLRLGDHISYQITGVTFSENV